MKHRKESFLFKAVKQRRSGVAIALSIVIIAFFLNSSQAAFSSSDTAVVNVTVTQVYPSVVLLPNDDPNGTTLAGISNSTAGSVFQRLLTVQTEVRGNMNIPTGRLTLTANDVSSFSTTAALLNSLDGRVLTNPITADAGRSALQMVVQSCSQSWTLTSGVRGGPTALYSCGGTIITYGAPIGVFHPWLPSITLDSQTIIGRAALAWPGATNADAVVVPLAPAGNSNFFRVTFFQPNIAGPTAGPYPISFSTYNPSYNQAAAMGNHLEVPYTPAMIIP